MKRAIDFFERSSGVLKERVAVVREIGKKKYTAWHAAYQENTLWQDSQVFLRDTYVRLAVKRQYGKRELFILFAIAFLAGAGFKSILRDTLTIGFDDYTLAPAESRYDLNAVQQQFIGKGSSLINGNAGRQAATCSQE
jgi:hypothetical protein